MTTLEKLIEEKLHTSPMEVLWELLKKELKITFDEPCNEDEMCRVLLNGYGVEIVHYPPSPPLSEEVLEKLRILCGKRVFVYESSDNKINGLLYYIGKNTWSILQESGAGFHFHSDEIKFVNGNGIWLR